MTDDKKDLKRVYVFGMPLLNFMLLLAVIGIVVAIVTN